MADRGVTAHVEGRVAEARRRSLMEQRLARAKAAKAKRLLAVEPVCAICGPGDPMFPPWADDCDHTEQERRRVH